MGRKTTTTTSETAFTAEELIYVEKYPATTFIPGSLVIPTADKPSPFGLKRCIDIKCPCGAVRTVASSDLFQVKMCVPCAKARRADLRAQARKDKAPVAGKDKLAAKKIEKLAKSRKSAASPEPSPKPEKATRKGRKKVAPAEPFSDEYPPEPESADDGPGVEA